MRNDMGKLRQSLPRRPSFVLCEYTKCSMSPRATSADERLGALLERAGVQLEPLLHFCERDCEGEQPAERLRGSITRRRPRRLLERLQPRAIDEMQPRQPARESIFHRGPM